MKLQEPPVVRAAPEVVLSKDCREIVNLELRGYVI